MKKNQQNIMPPSRSPLPTLSSPGTRTPSPVGRVRTPAPCTIRGLKKSHDDTPDESDTGQTPEFQTDEEEDGTISGIRYITESLLKKLGKQENIGFVNAMNLSLSKDGGKKFKFIENLEKCERLETLNLSYNLIEKIEKLDKQTKLRKLNLSYNKISKIEGIEHMQNLQTLNLAGNEIEHIPPWLAKKLRSLCILNLKQNKISSFQEVAKLKPLRDLTTLDLADNPVANLPHYRLCTIFHLRSLDNLDGQPVTNPERQEANERFNLDEIEKLERELEKKTKEIGDLKSEQSKVCDDLQNQDELNKSLKEETMQQKHRYNELERDLETKNEILKQKTLELTRACQKQYELEQELAFYKIDAKFEPLGYYNSESAEIDDAPGESTYIGKARYKRNLFTQETFIASPAQQMQVGKIALSEDDPNRNEQVHAHLHQALDVQLEDKEKHVQAAQDRLTALQREIIKAEQQILRATEELKELEDAVVQKKISEAEKENLRQQLSAKIQLLNQLRTEAQELEKQMERQRREMERKQAEIEELQTFLETMDPRDPRHSHVKAQKASKEQQLDVMNRQYKELEGRLDEMLSRIARETEEIKDLEQQLTEGQIAANEALKRDLEGIIMGLQEYLESVKGQAKQANDECRDLRTEKEALLQRLTDLEEERNQLEIVVMDAENMRKEIADLEQNLQLQQDLNESLRQAQGDLSEYEAELEAQLKVRDTEANQLKEELARQRRLSQMEHSALQSELGKERQALENAISKAQISEEKEQENKELVAQLQQLQEDNNTLNSQLKELQRHRDQTANNLIHPEQVTSRVAELKRKLQTGVGEVRCHNSADVLGKSLADLQKHFNEILARVQQEKEEACERQKMLQEEVAALQDKLRVVPDDYKKACNKAAEAKIKLEKRQNEAKIRHLENEIQCLVEKLKGMEEIQGLSDQQLQDADEERDKLLTELEDLENKRKLEDTKSQMQLLGLDKELKDLKRAMAASDKMATTELSIAKDQLKSLHGNILKLNQDRVEELQEAERFCARASLASRDLTKAEAEIELLQNILKKKEQQQFEISKLKQTMEEQKSEMERLRHLLDHAKADNSGSMENLLREIEALRHALSFQNDYITGMADPFRRRGYWYFVPSSSKASSHSSQSTKDSGVGLQYPSMPSPCRKGVSQSNRHPRKEEHLPPTRGHWVYSPFRSGMHKSHLHRDGGDGEASEEEFEQNGHPDSPFVPPPGSVIYTVFPDGAPAPQGTVIYGPPPPAPPKNGRPFAPGTVIYGPPPVGTQTVYGPPPAHFSIPLIPAGVLHCNVPEHHDLENEMCRLEDIVDHLKSLKREEKLTRVSEHSNRDERGRLHQGIEDLLHQKEELEFEVEELRRTARKHGKRKDFVDGHIDSLITELELEKSLKRHEDIVDEIDCIEKTLLKRRAELREADRLLAEAETELKDTREKTVGTIQKYSNARKHLSQTEKDAEELEKRAQDTAMNLVKADQQFRTLQEETKDLEQHKLDQEIILKEINTVVSARDAEFQSLNSKIERLTGSLEKLQDDIELAEGKEDHYLQMLKDAEIVLLAKKDDLERLNYQIEEQQEETVALDRMLGQKKEELHLLQDSIDQKKANLREVLCDGEAEVTEKRKEVREVKSLLEELSVQKGEMNAQLNEKRAQLALLKQEVVQEEENVQVIAGQITKHKTELKHVLEMLQLENNELQGLKLQHDQKVNELERTQVAVLEEKLELENLQRDTQRQRGEVEWQRQLLEKDHKEIEILMAQMHTLQDGVVALSKQRKQLEESCHSLENKLAKTKRVVAATEDRNKTALCTVEKLESNIKVLQQEIDQLNKQKLSVKTETTAIQQLLQEKRQELDLIKDELSDTREQVKLIEQDLSNATNRRDELLGEQATLKEEINESMRRSKQCQEKEERKEHQLQQLRRAIEERRLELAEQEKFLHQIRRDVECEEQRFEESATKLKDQKHVLEWELQSKQGMLEQVMGKVETLEERVIKHQKEEKWCSALEESLTKARHLLSAKDQQMQEKTEELLTLQKELDASKADLSRLQEQLVSERRKGDKRVTALSEMLKAQRTNLEKLLQEQKHEHSRLQNELNSIEQVARDHHERAKRLMKELSRVQHDYLDLKKQMKSQEELEKRQQEIRREMRMLKSEVKEEIRTSLHDFDQSHPEQLQDIDSELEDEDSLQCELESLKENFPFPAQEARHILFEEKLGLSKSHLMDEHWRGEALREKLRQHEDRLKVQLRTRMSKQADALSKRKQQAEGTLHNLKRKVDALDELVSNTSAELLFHSQNSTGLLGLEDTDLHSQNFLSSPARPTNGISSQFHNFPRLKS
ncbi:centriolin isoform X2 [Ambystoma mexicanum]|uniref:centriolin isoform X2 n=1 Tax=Ambystoma mexicanum TaxID=8296 RepID=UPI0037E9338E